MRMSFGSAEREISIVVNWFKQWSDMQKGDFLKDLVEKAVPDRMDALFDTMKALNVQDKPPSIFECQMKLFNQWFHGWKDDDVNNFMMQLRMIEPAFVVKFDQEVATARANSGL